MAWRLYRQRLPDWSTTRRFTLYRRDGGTRSCSWLRQRLLGAKLLPRAPRRGAHRKRHDWAPLPSMMPHQDESRHEWAPG